MKKFLVTSLVVMAGILGIGQSGQCASVGSPGADIKPGKLSVGVEQDYIFKRDLENKDFTKVVPVATGDTVAGDLHQYGVVKYAIKDLGRTMLKVGYQVSGNLNIYTKLGVTNGASMLSASNSGTWAKNNHPSVPENFGTYATTTARDEKTTFTGGVGFKILCPLTNDRVFGIDAQYLTNKKDYIKESTAKVYNHSGNLVPGYSTDTTDWNAGNATISEWHIAPFISKTFKSAVYYAGVKYSDFRWQAAGEELTLYAKNNVGAFAGADIALYKSFSLNLEGRFIDETAGSIKGSFMWGLPARTPKSTVKAVKVAAVKTPAAIVPAPAPQQKQTDTPTFTDKRAINFDAEKSDIRQQDIQLLQRIAQIIKDTKPAQVKVEGFTNNVGTPEHNLVLSQKRAATAKNFLISEGVAPALMETIGYGEMFPLVVTAGAAGNSPNDRVEFVIIPATAPVKQ
ncbi:MAG: OmpA family protein [Elusimicrobia bacterium]|nr:OmpA family protein [Elusimicrobiota bacterium]